MNAKERTKQLFIKAYSKYLISPTSSQVQKAIEDAEEQRTDEIVAALLFGGFSEAASHLTKKYNL